MKTNELLQSAREVIEALIGVASNLSEQAEALGIYSGHLSGAKMEHLCRQALMDGQDWLAEELKSRTVGSEEAKEFAEKASEIGGPGPSSSNGNRSGKSSVRAEAFDVFRDRSVNSLANDIADRIITFLKDFMTPVVQPIEVQGFKGSRARAELDRLRSMPDCAFIAPPVELVITAEKKNDDSLLEEKWINATLENWRGFRLKRCRFFEDTSQTWIDGVFIGMDISGDWLIECNIPKQALTWACVSPINGKLQFLVESTHRALPAAE